MKTNIPRLPCLLGRNRPAQTELMGLSGAHGHCARTGYTWQKGSPPFSTGAGLCSEGQLPESRPETFRTGNRASLYEDWQAVS